MPGKQSGRHLELDLNNVSNETAKIIFEIHNNALNRESERHSILIAKSQTLVTVATIIFASITLKDFSNSFANYLSLISLVSGTLSVLISLSLLHSRRYHQISLERLLVQETLSQRHKELLINVAVSCRDSINQNKIPMDDLFKKFDNSANALKVAAVSAILAFGVQYLTIAIGGDMNKTKSSKSDSTATTESPLLQPISSSKPKPNKTQLPGVGTQTEKRNSSAIQRNPKTDTQGTDDSK